MGVPSARLSVDQAGESTERIEAYEDIMGILQAFDLTGSCRAAAGIARCAHRTVEDYVALLDVGPSPATPSTPTVARHPTTFDEMRR